MNFEIILEDAFVSNNVGAITAALLREKASKSLVNRLNKVANKELDRTVFKSVTLLLRAIEDVCQCDEDCFNCLARQGLVYKNFHMLTWFERAADFLKMEEYKGVKDLPSLIETFFDFFLAIRTINSILDNTTKEERRKLSMSKDHCLLLEQFAKVILNVGDYEMQVALSEALCRMTIKRSRKELTNKWFANPVFAEGFNAINDTEFEIDCRTFLNDLNSYFGDESRVFTFPCICVFLDTTELFMPEDEKLEHFWVDFNLGTSCISLFVNNPEGSLWESIHLLRADVFRFSVCDCDNQTILTVHLSNPLTYRMTKGKMVQIIFDSKHDILDAAKRVFESKRLLSKSKGSPPPPAEAGSSVILSQRTKHDYTRKKPKTKSKLKILPLSSPSSADEASPVKVWTGADHGQWPYYSAERADSGGAAEKKSVPLESDPRQRPRAFFPSEPLEEAAESMSRVLNEEVESEMEMGSGVIAAFQTFKSQLRAHFSSRYKKIEARSLQSLMDCQKNVTSLLGAVHDSRLVHLERFQATVVQELGRLENDCISLKEIEGETVNFWQSESQSVRSFCDRQQQRLESLGEPRDGWSSMSQREEAAAPPEPPK
ncbi:synaptonemal complex protein 2-like [Salvelinus namaycush]|uniref:Synaptonemal complex protein 2-like n=1 Tax=Salvelinus namaycush TaxID=8040 RepID=A0A8U0R2U9_SALNM|nr:synaptonemal complex protein 2-like [Salvelinus namaycush]